MAGPESIAIIGAGAIGCLFAARLVRAGAAVTLIDVDGPRLAALNATGLTLADDAGERTVPVRAARAEEAVGPFDLLFFSVKGMHTAAAARSVAHLGGRVALTLQNGIGNAEAIADALRGTPVLMGVTDYPADLAGPARVETHGPGKVKLGGFTPEAEVHAGPVVALLRRAGFEAAAVPAVKVAVWEKVAFNAALNPLAYLTGYSVGQMNCAPLQAIAAAVVAETIAVAHAQGVAADPGRVQAMVENALAKHLHHKASMLQDRLAGRRTEIEAINGAIVRMGQAAGVPTPVTEAIANLVRATEAGPAPLP